jgi:hypothetical protein
MDLTAAAVNFKQAQTMSQVQMAVAAKVMQNDRMQGAAAVKLIEAATSNVQQAGDALVAQATGLGSQIDTYA